ncbi:hypothetical protein shn_30130 (plasmid) [Shinella sp. HZN7]|nr:hypothetical protein shn_30130 [Shinella sp. HZN7]
MQRRMEMRDHAQMLAMVSAWSMPPLRARATSTSCKAMISASHSAITAAMRAGSSFRSVPKQLCTL